MQMTGRMPPFSAVTSKRSIRLGLSRGSAALVTMTSWSTLATSTCCRPRLVRLTTPCRGSTRSMIPSSLPFGAKPDDVAGRDDVPLVGRQRFEKPPRRAFE